MGSGVLRHMEWSKRILIFSYFMLVVFIVIFLAADDKSAAANENRSKYALKFVRELAEKHGLDATARIIEAVLKD